MLEKSEPKVCGRVKVYPLKGLLCGFVGDQREFRGLGHLTIQFLQDSKSAQVPTPFGSKTKTLK